MNRLRILLLCVIAVCCRTAFAGDANALVRLAVASLRAEAAHASELETQALMGTPIQLDSLDGEWWRAILPDGYVAYVNETAVTPLDEVEMESWRRAPRLIGVNPFETHVLAEPSPGSAVVCDFVMGCIVEGVKMPGSEYTSVRLPDGRSGYVCSRDVEELEQWMARGLDTGRIIDISRSLNGVAYLWGGRSTKGLDCSGLTQLCFFDSGCILPRNASQQALCGARVDVDDVSSLRQGDLLFFENDCGRVTHVAVYDGETRYFHSSGLVHESSMAPEHSLYNGRVVSSARRVCGESPAGGVVRVLSHPWYFTQLK